MWSPEQYERFKAERKQPFLDLLGMVEPRPRMHVVDLGCGTGELTRELHDTLAADETLGIDSSETMLLKAGSFGGTMLRFQPGNIEGFVADRPFDLVFSNAALHWVSDHEELFTRLTSFLSPTGQLAIQMPDNDAHPSHAVAALVAARFGIEARPANVLPASRYSELLHRLGFKHQNVRLQIYGHLLPSSGDVVEWVRGALLTHYEALIPADQYPAFLEEYTRELQTILGDTRPYFYTYQRVLLWGSF